MSDPAAVSMPRRALAIAGAVTIAVVTAGCTSTDAADSPTTATSSARSAGSALSSQSVPLSPPPAEQSLPEATADRLQAVLDDWVAGGNNIGIAAAAVTTEGTWQGAAGRDGAGRDLAPASAMAIGSITKTFVAAEVLRLAGSGQVDLDAAVTDYVSVPFDTRGATVRQVLGMRSGFPLDPIDAVFESAADDLDRSWTTTEAIALADADGPRRGTVGQYYYNNLNYLVLGQLVEQVTGRPLAAALTTDLLEPAGLERVWLQDAQQPEPPLTVSEEDPDLDTVDDDGPWLPSRSMASSAGPAGGIAADAPSIARWGYLLYGGHVIDPALVEQMIASEEDSAEAWYGLGTEGWVHDGQDFVGHGGDIGTYHGMMVVAVDDHASIAVLVPAPARNAVEADVGTHQVPDLLLKALSQP